MPMGAVADRLQLSVADMKRYLGIPEEDTSKDADIQDALDAAKDDADSFLNNPFTSVDADGKEVPLPIPAAVQQWVKRRVARYVERPVEGMSIETLAGIGSTHWGPEEYQALWPYRKNPGL